MVLQRLGPESERDSESQESLVLILVTSLVALLQVVLAQPLAEFQLRGIAPRTDLLAIDQWMCQNPLSPREKILAKKDFRGLKNLLLTAR